MSKNLVETGTENLFEAVRFKKGCGLCPSGCRTVCQRYKTVSNDMVKGEMDDFALDYTMPDYGSFRKKKQDTEE
jgi:hypothetical protein